MSRSTHQDRDLRPRTGRLPSGDCFGHADTPVPCEHPWERSTTVRVDMNSDSGRAFSHVSIDEQGQGLTIAHLRQAAEALLRVADELEADLRP